MEIYYKVFYKENIKNGNLKNDVVLYRGEDELRARQIMIRFAKLEPTKVIKIEQTKILTTTKIIAKAVVK